MPIEPAAPGWLVTNTCWFQCFDSPSATMRAMTSGAPPAPVVTISLTGALGKFCARASENVAQSANAPTSARMDRIAESLMSPLPLSAQLIFFAVSAITGRQIGLLLAGERGQFLRRGRTAIG